MATVHPEVVEAMTCGVFTVDEAGQLDGDPAVLTWAEAFARQGT